MTNKVIRTERGWAGHFICSPGCLFRRNTLLEYREQKIVVSTVGALLAGSLLSAGARHVEMVGADRYYETMAFHANPSDTRYHDADVTQAVYFDSPWDIRNPDGDDLANDMHEAVVAELTAKLKNGEIL